MSVYKEIGYMIREIEQKSRRVWNDSCDYGVPIYSLKDPIILQTKGIIEMYNLKPTTSTYATGKTQTIKFDGGASAVIEAGFEQATIEYITWTGKRPVIDGKPIIGYLTATTETSAKARQEAMAYDM